MVRLPMVVRIQLETTKEISTAADALVLLVAPGDYSADPALVELDARLGGGLVAHLQRIEWKAERAAVLSLPSFGRGVTQSVVLAGLGAEPPDEDGKRTTLIAALAAAGRALLASKVKSAIVRVPEGADLEAVGLGVELGVYAFDRYFLATKAKRRVLEKVLVHAPGRSSGADKAAFGLGAALASGVCLARDLVNEPPNVLYPETFAERARAVAKKHDLGCKILDEKGILKEKMLLHYAVGQGSRRGPRFIHLTYKPKNKKGSIAFVGKGLTFDSGGLCIKPMAGMADMKSDMAGGAAVLGLMSVIAELAPDLEVHGIIGCAENMPDGNAYRPADVIQSLAGKGVEIINTDAEGRLVLADALTYAARLAPDFIVDAATLTGATMVSLGTPYSAFFTPVDSIAEAMSGAAKRAGESFWRMPLIEELMSQLKSDVTDLKHTGDRFGGAITAALFLREFTLGVPWMHWDVPGATYREEASGYHPKGGTGHGVLTFVELVRRHAKSPIAEAPKKEARKNDPGLRKIEGGAKKAATPPARTPKGPRKATPRRP